MIGSTESSIDILLGNEESEIVDNEDIIARRCRSKKNHRENEDLKKKIPKEDTTKKS